MTTTAWANMITYICAVGVPVGVLMIEVVYRHCKQLHDLREAEKDLEEYRRAFMEKWTRNWED